MAITYELGHPVTRVFKLLTDKAFLTERLEAVGEDPPDISISKKGKKVEIRLQRAARRDLPKVAAKLIGSVQKFSMEEFWHADGEGWSGHYLIEFVGVPGSVTADFDLYPSDDGCIYSITHKPNVKMPVIGKTLEKILVSQVEDGCDAEIDYLAEVLG